MKSTLQVLSDRQERPDDLVAAGEIVELHFRDGRDVMSLRAAKAFHLLIKAAGERAGEAVEHRIKVMELTAIAHLTIDEIVETVRDIVGTVIEVRQKIGAREEVLVDPLIHSVRRPIEEDMTGAAEISYRLSDTLRLVLQNSAYWAVLSRKAVLAFQSRYALRLYEILSLRAGLDHLTSETFDLGELRRRFGVPKGKLDRWQDFKRFALELAIEEVNHLSPFTVTYEPVLRRGRGRPSVTGIEISWVEKDKTRRIAALRELEASRVGRKARRRGTVEQVVEPPATLPGGFPSTGGISYSRWGEIAREELPRPTPDIDQVATGFRRWAEAKGLPLAGGGIERTFRGFCKNWQG